MSEEPIRAADPRPAPAGDGRPASLWAVVDYGPLARRALTVVAVAAAVAVGLWVISYAAHIFLVGFAGVLLAVLLRGLAKLLTRCTRLPVGVSLAVVIVVLLGLLFLAGWLVAPGVAAQGDQIESALRRTLTDFQQKLGHYDWGRRILQESQKIGPTQLAEGAAGGGAAGVAGVFTGAVDFVVDVIVFLFVGVFLAASPQTYRDGFLLLFSEHRRPRVRQVLDDVGARMARWLLGRFISMVVIGVSTGVGLWLIGVPMAPTLGLLTGLLDFVPTFGPILAAIPTVLVALTISPMEAVYAVALYTAIGCFDGNVVTPLVQMRVSEVPPALLIFSQVLMGVLAGGLGLALAAPLLVAALVVVREVYVEDILQKGGRGVEVRPAA